MKYRFTNRTGGASSGAFASLNLGTHVFDDLPTVLANRALLAAQVGPIQYMTQVHGNRVVVIEEVTDEDPTADALVTGIPGVSLAVQVADCIPLLLHSGESVAAVHVGRKGLVNGVALAALETMRDMGSSEITAIIGPSICGNCYEVSQEIYDEVTALHPAAASRTAQGTPALDLPAALRVLLESQSIALIDESRCTLENDDLYSYRRDGVTGRQAGIISL
ncbi:peptidoglycan editing factor PgeF [Candidatus Planktophila dulcis]|uniref:peptidoglycan editing factor PgeF n=1 Tax=Candidatus Planktophila dulcis TaxID=1884914 RepID=UPI003CEEEE01